MPTRRGTSCPRTTSATPASRSSGPRASRSRRRWRGEGRAIEPKLGRRRPRRHSPTATGTSRLHSGAKKTAAGAGPAAVGKDRGSLGNVARDELGHLEHRNLRLAAEHDLELVVGVDLGPDLLVLQTVLLDVRPELLGELRAGEGGRANDSSEG